MFIHLKVTDIFLQFLFFFSDLYLLRIVGPAAVYSDRYLKIREIVVEVVFSKMASYQEGDGVKYLELL